MHRSSLRPRWLLALAALFLLLGIWHAHRSPLIAFRPAASGSVSASISAPQGDRTEEAPLPTRQISLPAHEPSLILSAPQPNQLQLTRRPHWLLVGKVVGPQSILERCHAEDIGHVVLSYDTGFAETDRHRLRAGIAADGSFSLDLDPLTTSGSRSRSSGAGPFLLEWRSTTSLAPARRIALDSAVDAGPDEAGRPLRVLEARLELRAAAGLRGQVLSADEKPVAGGKLLLVHPAGTARAYALVQQARTDANGGFRLVVDTFEPLLLACVGPDDAPLVVPVSPEAGVEQDLGMLRLPAGAALEGHVRMSGDAPAPTMISATLSRTDPNGTDPRGTDPRGVPSGDAGVLLLWSAQQAQILQREARVAPDGHFVLKGLAPGLQRVSWASSAGCSLPGLEGFSTEVLAPARGLQLTRADSLIAFEVQSRGVPCDDAEVFMLAEPHPVRCIVDPAGRTQWIVRAGVEYRFRIQRPDCEPVLRTLRGPDVGTTVRCVVELACPGSGELLLIWEQNLRGELVRRARVRIVDANEPDFQTREWFGDYTRSGVLVQDFPAGLWKIRVETGGTWNGYMETLLPQEPTVRVDRGRRVQVRMPVERGAVLCLENAQAQSLKVERIEGPKGPVSLERLYFPHRSAVAGDAELPAGTRAVLIPPLPAGSYRVEARLAGMGEPKVRTVQLRAAQVTALPW
jgi:hypothetical protein